MKKIVILLSLIYAGIFSFSSEAKIEVAYTKFFQYKQEKLNRNYIIDIDATYDNMGIYFSYTSQDKVMIRKRGIRTKSDASYINLELYYQNTFNNLYLKPYVAYTKNDFYVGFKAKYMYPYIGMEYNISKDKFLYEVGLEHMFKLGDFEIKPRISIKNGYNVEAGLGFGYKFNLNENIGFKVQNEINDEGISITGKTIFNISK